MAQCNSMMLQLMFEQDQRFYIWCDALISTNKATDDDVTIPINDAQFWSTMLQTTMVLWIWSMMSRMTMMFQSCSTMLRTMIMLLNLVQRMKTRFKDINTWFKKRRGNQRKSKCKERNELNFNYSELPYHHKHYSEIKGLNTCNALVGT